MNLRTYLSGVVEPDVCFPHGIVRPVGDIPVALPFCGRRLDPLPVRRRRESDGFPVWPLSHIVVNLPPSYPLLLQSRGEVFDWDCGLDAELR